MEKKIRKSIINILLIGDPGIGKSMLALYALRVAPKARKISGAHSSGAGATVSVIKDEFIGSWALEAGAVILASKGILIFDEFDKMNPEDRARMHEQMAHETISVDKANIHCVLNAPTSILAIANPKEQRFVNYANVTIAEQFNLSAPLLNRFELIFTIKDEPDSIRDTNIAIAIMDVWMDNGKTKPLISNELFKRYIVYAKHIEPNLTEEVRNKIIETYCKIRKRRIDSEKAVPITPRQIEALIHLSIASARVRLSKKVEKDDAERAIRLLMNSLKGIAIDEETGELDIDKIEGVPKSIRDKKHIILEIIKGFESKLGKVVPIEDVIAECNSKGISELEADDLIERLRRNGDIMENRRGFISLV